ncbi:KpsF/GutQ family sugar-phosphate isomerase [Desulfobaculum bizertense]|uniref:Arabinose-5-phosphate isomerase n=1 Tax=Desulfobaculum bizertense DSM 18034 TaxID=1121442 RepID=A0A1T4VZE6_9BACT|nr:KpsF/GutQ family sugar-phosphate isomerase [Desulfobaculum bizertense]SKA70195.1 arabinose-5-phosphate isomerase [Desulfobaculum bizertense DSM 18034]
MENCIEIAKRTFSIEAASIQNLTNTIGDDFKNAVKIMQNCKEHVAVSGMGKSGLIGKKIAATLASTGTPSFFMHPAEAAHGDFGMLKKDDVLIAISYSGETEEILRIVPLVTRMRVPIIAITGNPHSTLAKAATAHLDVSVKQEACPLQLAPTSSTAATLAMGDALAMAIMELDNFTPRDFAFRHPGGSLGKRLLTQVKDAMDSRYLPIVPPEMTLKKVISIMNTGMKGIAVVTKDDKIQGVITDGDLRRTIDKFNGSSLEKSAAEVMTKNPVTIDENCMLTEAEELMHQNKIITIPVVSNAHNKRLVGIVQHHVI